MVRRTRKALLTQSAWSIAGIAITYQLYFTLEPTPMPQSTNHLHSFLLQANGRGIGVVADLCLGYARWTVRYLLVATENWLPRRRGPISPKIARAWDWSDRMIPPARSSPGTASDEPISRQHEEELKARFDGSVHWTTGAFGLLPTAMFMPAPQQGPGVAARRIHFGPCLCGVQELKEFDIEARDGSIGDMSDSVFDNETWEFAFIFVDAERPASRKTCTREARVDSVGN